ncbi:PREDICTED: patatin-like phospholipase domain-containing protein 5 isoform X2 [Colobus angolensis palliatus]|uniref:patatin-like phospholipase domain-containing protein 5 isoform X2 n=1 Tax=Colobus angolensis palliatus TaxID=336983 RepID=UPI0005F4451C|nr:PREDICTED: patatin-like phospholipase domain-containing protein 5 isoform X2 [Colobus angolensis palliatus]
MGFSEEEGSWNLSFAGAGYLGLYHVGATECLRQRAPHLLQGARRIYGSSSGALNAVSILCGKSVGDNNLPFADCPSTITVSPFHGTVDICPQSTSPNLHELNAFNASFQISTKNFFLGFISLIPPSLEVVADNCRQGYLDALRFLERRGLTKEPVLWTLVSKEPPVPADGNWDAGCDQCWKRGLSLNWKVPHVQVKDISNFEQLSPELEAALKKACTRDPSPWARFWRSGPGQVLTYVLLPCTLPFEYVYFRSRRLVAWLPDVPADLWWMQGLLRSVALEVFSRTKAQLLGPISPPATGVLETSPLQPQIAPYMEELRPTQQA